MKSSNDKEILLNSFVNNVKILQSQRRILECLNEFLDFYPDIVQSDEDFIYQDSVSRKYAINSILNGFKMGAWVGGSLLVSNDILNADLNNFQFLLAFLIPSFIGFSVLQKGNSKEYNANSLDCDSVIKNMEFVDLKLNNILDEMSVALEDFMNLCKISRKAFLENDVIEKIFVNNGVFIDNGKYVFDFNYDLDYDKICEAFNEVFNLQGGFNEFFSIYYDFKDVEGVKAGKNVRKL